MSRREVYQVEQLFLHERSFDFVFKNLFSEHMSSNITWDCVSNFQWEYNLSTTLCYFQKYLKETCKY